MGKEEDMTCADLVEGCLKPMDLWRMIGYLGFTLQVLLLASISLFQCTMLAPLGGRISYHLNIIQ